MPAKDHFALITAAWLALVALTLASLGCHPLSALTAVTVQDTAGVRSVHPVAADVLGAAGRVNAEIARMRGLVEAFTQDARAA